MLFKFLKNRSISDKKCHCSLMRTMTFLVYHEILNFQKEKPKFTSTNFLIVELKIHLFN